MDATRKKLIDATIAEIEQSGLQATAKQIAHRAGVNELTLFRHFGTKHRLVEIAIRESIGPFIGKSQQPTGQIKNDLQAIARQYVRLADTHPGLIKSIFTASNDDSVDMTIKPLQQHFADLLLQIMRFYVRQGTLRNIDESDLVREFMGPLVARALLAHALPIGTFDEERYVHRFLDGHIKRY